MTVKIDNFDYDLVENYYLKNLLENQFWLFGSHANEEVRPQSDNTEQDARLFLEKAIFGIQYNTNDFSFMLPLRLWQRNTVYTQYDDEAVLRDQPFFVVVDPEIESGSYHIFKCISNNYNSPSTETPEFNPSIQNGIYNLSDGYTWKYMSSTPFVLFRKFFARGLLPVVRNQQVENIANKGIYNIIIENPERNSGYEKITGNVQGFEVQNGITRIFLKNTFTENTQEIPIFDVENTYSNRAIYLQKSTVGSSFGAIELTIRDSGVFQGNPFVTVSTPDPSIFVIQENDIIEILPKIEITGNGSGASAVAVMTDNRITNIRILQYGDNYTSAFARVIDPESFDPSNINRRDIRCIIRPIISPKGGHGSNILSELKTKNIGLSKVITSSNGDIEIPSSGFYSKLGIVKTPEFQPTANTFSDLPTSENEINDKFFVVDEESLYFWQGDPPQWVEKKSFDNRIKIELVGLPENLQVGDVITQGDANAFVHEIDTSANSIFIVEYDGPYTDIFESNLPITYENENIDINNIEYSPYVSRSGKLLSIVNVTPIERDEQRSEQIRLILDF